MYSAPGWCRSAARTPQICYECGERCRARLRPPHVHELRYTHTPPPHRPRRPITPRHPITPSIPPPPSYRPTSRYQPTATNHRRQSHSTHSWRAVKCLRLATRTMSTRPTCEVPVGVPAFLLRPNKDGRRTGTCAIRARAAGAGSGLAVKARARLVRSHGIARATDV